MIYAGEAVLEPQLEEEDWDLEIRPREKLFHLHLKELWNYRDLLWLLVRRDFVSFYKQTVFGPLWFFIQPIFTTILFTIVFSKMGKFSTDQAPAPLFYLCGIVAWNYFAECITKTSTVFRDNSHIFGKVYFPRLIMPLSIVLSNLVRFGVQFILFLLLLAYYSFQGPGINIQLHLMLFPLVLLSMALLGLGCGLMITAMTTKYRDLAFLVSFGIQLLMYLSPVIYPLSAAPGKYKLLVSLNPISGLLETFRFGFLGSGSFNAGTFTYSLIVSVLVFFTGLIIFNKVEKDFIDTI